MKTLWKILGIGMLVAILGSMTLGPVTSAQSERSEEDCEAIGLRLREMVENGELTCEEARERYSAACGRVSGAEYRAIVARIRAAVEAGEMTRDEAGEMLEGLRRRMAMAERQGRLDWERAWSRLLIEVASEELGISARELWAELKAGATIADISEAQGVDQQALYDAYIVRLTERLDQAVEEGTISQADADEMLTKVHSWGVGLLSRAWTDVSNQDGSIREAGSGDSIIYLPVMGRVWGGPLE